MAARATWKGFLKISLVNIPVKVFPATESSGTISFNQFHGECQTRIQHGACPGLPGTADTVGVSGRAAGRTRATCAQRTETDRDRRPNREESCAPGIRSLADFWR